MRKPRSGLIRGDAAVLSCLLSIVPDSNSFTKLTTNRFIAGSHDYHYKIFQTVAVKAFF
jgi:hypothetical protein